MTLFILLILFLAYIKFEPVIDKTNDGEYLLWYNSGGNYKKERDYITLGRW